MGEEPQRDDRLRDGTNYCPSSAVTRLAMAAFMKRLGDALTPIQLVMDLRPGAVDLDANTVVCQTADFNVTGFPRTAYADATLSASATADVSFAADLVMSTDAGANWTPLNPRPTTARCRRTSTAACRTSARGNLEVNGTVRFGVRHGPRRASPAPRTSPIRAARRAC